MSRKINATIADGELNTAHNSDNSDSEFENVADLMDQQDAHQASNDDLNQSAAPSERGSDSESEDDLEESRKGSEDEEDEEEGEDEEEDEEEEEEEDQGEGVDESSEDDQPIVRRSNKHLRFESDDEDETEKSNPYATQPNTPAYESVAQSEAQSKAASEAASDNEEAEGGDEGDSNALVPSTAEEVAAAEQAISNLVPKKQRGSTKKFQFQNVWLRDDDAKDGWVQRDYTVQYPTLVNKDGKTQKQRIEAFDALMGNVEQLINRKNVKGEDSKEKRKVLKAQAEVYLRRELKTRDTDRINLGRDIYARLTYLFSNLFNSSPCSKVFIEKASRKGQSGKSGKSTKGGKGSKGQAGEGGKRKREVDDSKRKFTTRHRMWFTGQQDHPFCHANDRKHGEHALAFVIRVLFEMIASLSGKKSKDGSKEHDKFAFQEHDGEPCLKGWGFSACFHNCYFAKTLNQGVTRQSHPRNEVSRRFAYRDKACFLCAAQGYWTVRKFGDTNKYVDESCIRHPNCARTVLNFEDGNVEMFYCPYCDKFMQDHFEQEVPEKTKYPEFYSDNWVTALNQRLVFFTKDTYIKLQEKMENYRYKAISKISRGEGAALTEKATTFDLNDKLVKPEKRVKAADKAAAAAVPATETEGPAAKKPKSVTDDTLREVLKRLEALENDKKKLQKENEMLKNTLINSRPATVPGSENNSRRSSRNTSRQTSRNTSRNASRLPSTETSRETSPERDGQPEKKRRRVTSKFTHKRKPAAKSAAKPTAAKTPVKSVLKKTDETPAKAASKLPSVPKKGKGGKGRK
jgi:hypothetical protein